MTNRADMRTAILTQLSGAITTDWSATELNEAISQAVAEITRYNPLHSVFVINFNKTLVVTFTSNYDVAVTLTVNPIQHGSEVITTLGGSVTYARETDYEMDYINGTITVLSTGAMADATSFLATYDRDQSMFNISGLTNPIEVIAVEIVGRIPQSLPSFEVFGDFLTITEGRDGGSQSRISDNTNIRIYYLATHTDPGDTTNGTFERYLDPVVISGAAGYACRIKALQREISAGVSAAAGSTQSALVVDITDLASVETALDAAQQLAGARLTEIIDDATSEIDAFHSTIATLLTTFNTDVGTYRGLIIEGAANNQAGLAVVDVAEAGLDLITNNLVQTIITKIEGDTDRPYDDAKLNLNAAATEAAVAETASDKADALITALAPPILEIDAIADTLVTELAKMLEEITDGATTGATEMLDAGDGLLNKINEGGVQAPLDYIAYATARLATAQGFGNVADRRTQDEVATRINYIDRRFAEMQSRLSESAAAVNNVNAYVATARSYIENGSLLVAQANLQLEQVKGYLSTSLGHTDIVRAYVEVGGAYIRELKLTIDEINVNIELIGTKISEANVIVNGANALVAEASQRIQKLLIHKQAVDAYLATAQQEMLLSNIFNTEADRRLGEFRNILRDQVKPHRYSSSRHQYKPN